MNEKRNAVIYARYSSDKQTEQSIEGQIRVCMEYAEKEGITIVGQYIDRAISGRSADRPEFLHMVEESGHRQFQFVLVYKLDRFSRDRYNSAFYKNKLKKNGVRVLSATENISDNPEGKLLEGILETMDEFFSEELRRKVQRGMKESALKGNSTGGSIPLGYRVGPDKKLHIDPDTAPIVQTAYEMYADGKGKKQIAETLNAKGYRTSRGNLFTANSFNNLLQNRKYTGVYTYNNEIAIEGGCPALVSLNLFNRVQLKIAETKTAPARAKAAVDYLLSGKLFCGECGTSMVGECGKSRNGTQYHYYACRKKKKEHTCKKLNERKDYLEWYICEQTLAFLSESQTDMIAERIVQAYKKEMRTGQVAELENRLNKVNGDLNKLVDAIIEMPSAKILLERLSVLEEQKENIEMDLCQARIAAKRIPTKEEIIKWLNYIKGFDPLQEKDRKQVIDIFVNSVYLWDNKVIICFNLKDSKRTRYIDVIREYEKALEDCSDLHISGEPFYYRLNFAFRWVFFSLSD